MTIAPTRFNLLSVFETAYGANLVGVTIMRIRGIMYTVGSSNTDNEILRAGIKVTDDVAAPVAGDNLFNPADTGGAHDDWMLWEPFFNGVQAATPTNAQHFGDGLGGRLVDTKATRRLNELGQTLVLDVNAQSTAGADPVFAFDLSILVALP